MIALIIVQGVYFIKKLNSKEDARTNQFLKPRPKPIAFSRHARCRWHVAFIDSSEVIEILEQVPLITVRTDTTGSRDPKFALEGRHMMDNRYALCLRWLNQKLLWLQ
jgi:hypothetical protein